MVCRSKKLMKGIHDIGDHKAHEKRQTQTLCHFQKCMYGIADAGQVADDFFKKYSGCQHDEYIYSNFKIWLICFFPIPFFQCRCAPLFVTEFLSYYTMISWNVPYGFCKNFRKQL